MIDGHGSKQYFERYNKTKESQMNLDPEAIKEFRKKEKEIKLKRAKARQLLIESR